MQLRVPLGFLAISLALMLLTGCGSPGASTGGNGLTQTAQSTLSSATGTEPTTAATAAQVGAVATPALPGTAPTETTRPMVNATSTPAPSRTASAMPKPTSSPPPATEAPTGSPGTAMPPTTPTEATSRQGSLASIQLRVQPVLGGLDRPVGIAHAGDGSGRLFVVEKGGRIRVVHDDRLESTLFLDISARVGSKGNEQGLLGLAFHPNFQNNGFFYVNYTDLQGNTVIARFSRSADPARADPNSELVLLRLIQPAGNHNGGHLAFGPDGYLYIGTGDGGGAGDQYGHGQNTSSLLGKMLRIDVDGGAPYAIPASNPFVNDPAVRDEIWALGLRNPWRYAFDRQSGDLFIADVGQNRYEEVNVQPADSRGAENYGWPIMEGQHCFPDSRVCDPSGLVLPAVEYDHNLGCSVTGGVVYRGRSSPALAGIYLFGDYCSGTIWGMARAPGGPWTYAVLAQTDLAVTAFGEDESGEIYLVDIRRGELLTISAAPK